MTIYPPRNLLPGQYQIDNLLMGRNTTVRVESFQIKPYDLNIGDYQTNRGDQMHFGWDQIKPTTIEITFHVMKNWLLPQYENLIPNFWREQPTVGQFSQAWRSDAIRYSWGEMKCLYVCGNDGITRAVYGRPGQFTYAKDTPYTESIQCLGEFRRADALSHSANELGFALTIGDDPVFLIREVGDGPDAWLRILLVGPLTNPVVTIGNQQIGLKNKDGTDFVIAEGDIIEVSSYPWQQRIIDSNQVNQSALLDENATRYLDLLRIPFMIPTPIRATADNQKTWVPALGNKNWQEDIEGYTWWTLPNAWRTIHGQVITRWSMFDFGSTSFPYITPRNYLATNTFDVASAILYDAQQFNTAYQRCEADIVEPFGGKSAIVIMSDGTMTNFICVEVESNIGSNWLRIRTGSAYDNLVTKAQWQNPNPYGWQGTDRVGIKAVPNATTGIVTYSMLLNGAVVGTPWVDTTGIVGTTALNRYQGFIFNIDGTWATQGTGFANIASYDTQENPDITVPNGKVIVAWRDSWGMVV